MVAAGWIWTNDLQVMSLTSYQTALLRDISRSIIHLTWRLVSCCFFYGVRTSPPQSLQLNKLSQFLLAIPFIWRIIWKTVTVHPNNRNLMLPDLHLINRTLLDLHKLSELIAVVFDKGEPLFKHYPVHSVGFTNSK